MPLLFEVYSEGCMSNLSQLARDSDETSQMLQKFVYEPFYK
jgi:hypothetical protein